MNSLKFYNEHLTPANQFLNKKPEKKMIFQRYGYE